MSGAGTSSASQTTQTESKTNPWKPTQDPLKQVVSGISGQIPNYQPTAAETGALNTISANAQNTPNYGAQAQQLTQDLFSGGVDRTGLVSNAYADYQKQAQPYLDPSYLDPGKNPYFNDYTAKLADSAANRVNSMFAASGRDMSGANMAELGRGITEATLPVFANQYNQNVSTQRGLMDNMFAAGGQAAGLLSGLDQTALGNRSAGAGAAQSELDMNNMGANSILQAEALRRGLPLQNLQQLSSLLLPIAGAGSQSSGTAASQGTQTMSPLQQAMGWTSLATNFGGGAGGGAVQGLGGGIKYLGGIFSDRRLKDDVKPVGKLDNGLTVYSYRYKAGGPVQIGLMADEVEAVAPEAVGNIGGYKTVRYELAVA